MRRREDVQCAHEVLDSLDVGLPWDGSFRWWRLVGDDGRCAREDNRDEDYMR